MNVRDKCIQRLIYHFIAVVKCLIASSGNSLLHDGPLPVWYFGLPMLSGLLAEMVIWLETGLRDGQFFASRFVTLPLKRRANHQFLQYVNNKLNICYLIT